MDCFLFLNKRTIKHIIENNEDRTKAEILRSKHNICEHVVFIPDKIIKSITPKEKTVKKTVFLLCFLKKYRKKTNRLRELMSKIKDKRIWCCRDLGKINY